MICLNCGRINAFPKTRAVCVCVLRSLSHAGCSRIPAHPAQLLCDRACLGYAHGMIIIKSPVNFGVHIWASCNADTSSRNSERTRISCARIHVQPNTEHTQQQKNMPNSTNYIARANGDKKKTQRNDDMLI